MAAEHAPGCGAWPPAAVHAPVMMPVQRAIDERGLPLAAAGRSTHLEDGAVLDVAVIAAEAIPDVVLQRGWGGGSSKCMSGVTC